MRFSGYPIYRLLLCLIIGIVVVHYEFIADRSYLLLGIGISSLLVLSTTFLFPYARTIKVLNAIGIYSFFIFLGMIVMNWSDDRTNSQHFFNSIEPRKNQILHLELYKRLAPNQYNDRFYARLHQVDKVTTTGNVLVLLKLEDSLSYSVGDQLIAYDDVSSASNERNPGDFNYAAYLALIDVHGQIYLDKDKILEIRSNSIDDDFLNFRNHLLTLLENSGLNEQPAAIIEALILGQRQHLDVEVTNNFRNAGVIHILALSGLHVGIILLILNFLTKWMHSWKYGRWIQSVFIICCLWAFALLTGMSPSILRAVTMFSFVAIGMNIKRKGSTYHSLAISAFVLLMINPKLLFQVGFQLSYTAVFFIVLLQPVIYRIFPLKNRITKFFWRITSVTIAAQIGVAPLSLFYFHQFPGLFLLGNMILLPILPLIIGASILLIVLLLFGFKPTYLEHVLNFVLEWIIKLVGQISSFEQFIISEVYLNSIELFFIYFVLIFTSWFFSNRLRRSRKERIIPSPAKWELHIALIGVAAFLGLQISEQLSDDREEYVLLHQAAGSAISMSNKDNATLLADLHTMNEERKTASLNRLKATTLQRSRNSTVDSLFNVLRIGDKTIQIIDESGVYNENLPTDVLLLSHSPQIHLERVINNLKPAYILVDGSNYHYHIKRWQKTCEEQEVTLMNTYELGAIDLVSLEAYTQN